MSTLIVTLSAPGQPGHELAYCLTTNAQTISSHGNAALALLPRADETVLLLPSTALSWHRVTLPKLSRSTSAQKMRAVLDGLAEEQLLDDTAALHIAPYRPSDSTDNTTWLAVCDKDWLVQHLRSVQAAGHKVSRIVPQAFPLSAVDADTAAVSHRVHVSGTPEAAWVTLTDASGVLTVPLAHARAAWPEIGADAQVSITAEPAVAAAAEAVLSSKVTIVQSAQQALQATLDARSYGVDLAHGDIAVTGSGRWLQLAGTMVRDLAAAPAWRAARIGFALLLLANVVGLNVWAWKERNALVAKRTLVNQLLTTTFPQVKVVVDAPVQMQREVSSLRQASGTLGSRDLESMYARFAAIAAVNAAPAAIDFAAGEVTVKGSGMAASQLSGLQGKLQNAGLAVRSDADRIVISEASTPRAGATP
jgi:general secretion pathway protein L